MLAQLPLTLTLLLPLVAAHGKHKIEGIDDRSYMQKHAEEEHHLTDFDIESFFHLHDLNQDNHLSIPEIESLYGLHHPSALSSTPVHPNTNAQAALDSKRSIVVEKVLRRLDLDGDKRVSLEEFVRGGVEGLPSFVGWEGLGHHYGSEEEYFLHHEELYHNTPETQTDESYNHPEDIEHFAQHHHIEAEEDARERTFEGLASSDPLNTDRTIQDPLDVHSHAPGEGPGAQTDDREPSLGERGSGEPGESIPPRRPSGSSPGKPARIERTRPTQQSAEELLKIRGDGVKGVWGERDMGRPRNDRERMRKGVPYKYKMGRNNEF